MDVDQFRTGSRGFNQGNMSQNFPDRGRARGRGFGRGRGRNSSHNANGRDYRRGYRGSQSLDSLADSGGSWRKNSSHQNGATSREHGNRKQRKHPMGWKELNRLLTLQADVVVLELLCDKSGFYLLMEEDQISPDKLDQMVKVLALATTTRSNREVLYELLNKTFGKNFVRTLMEYAVTLRRQYAHKGQSFFSDLFAILETFSSGMTVFAVEHLLNLIDSCHTILVTMQQEGHIESQLVKRYKDLLDMLIDSSKKWEQEQKMDSQDRKKMRETEMDYMEPPDDFREISVLPTPLDLADTGRPFLRRNIVQGHYSDGNHYLDVQFRLLREDFLRPLRTGIDAFKNDSHSKIMDVRIYRNVTCIGTTMKYQKIYHEIQLNVNRKVLESSKRLMYGNLVCFSKDKFRTIILGAVAERDPEKLKNGIVGVEFEHDIGIYDMSGKFTMVESRAYFMPYKHVLQALKTMPENIPMEPYIVHVDPNIDAPKYMYDEQAYDLRVIKSNTMLKRSEAVKLFERSRNKEEFEEPINNENDNLQNVHVWRNLVLWPSENELGLDSSQRRALRSALNRELAIIQGPPGTGKTFIGLKIVQILLHNSNIWKDKTNPTPILVVCFTNHALDQFLEGMTLFTNNIVRVGSRTQSEKISKYQINNMVRTVVRFRDMPQSIFHRKLTVKDDVRVTEQEIRICREVESECNSRRGIFSLNVFSSSNVIPDNFLHQLSQVPGEEKITHWLTSRYQPQNISKHITQKSSNTPETEEAIFQQSAGNVQEDEENKNKWKDAEDLLGLEERDRMIEEEEYDYLEGPLESQMKFEVSKDSIIRELERLWNEYQTTGDETTYLRYIIRYGHLEAIDHGFKLHVNRQEMTALENRATQNIWSLNFKVKWQLYKYWVMKLHEKIQERLKLLSEGYEKRVKALNEIKNQEYLYAMRKSSIVGMTTTGAAQYNSILQDLAPAIVVIEEAAEILESHVITSLTTKCQHLILIGDHQQLQPSATVYELATKYGLETSLFERMIKNGLAYETLEYQHRMRPDISRLLVPSIYPTLKDHPSVHEYPNVLGITKNVFFISHQNYEKMESDDNNSHENQHEAQFMMGLCRHLVLQGYDPKDITILTPYSGQFFLLRKLQRKYITCNGVRICVVDNFQGEENKIILLSLVRSNIEGKVGFLRTENRVCVALSRAKHGLYIIGNMDLLSECCNLWKTIREDLSNAESLGEYLTLQCENHPDQLSTVSSGEDFHTKSPEGGCLQLCAKPLPKCRHCCPKICHMDDLDHIEYRCRVPCPKILCSLDHKCPKLCWEDCGPCLVMMNKNLPCGHTHTIPCHVAPEAYKCPTLVVKEIPTCQHKATMPCHTDPKHFICPEDCDTRVDCGHKCRYKCHRTKDPDHLHYSCMEQCTKINVRCNQSHPCYKKCYQKCGACTVKVDKKLSCGHEAQGVECSQSEEEIKCKKKCKKTLPCGHACKKLCYSQCGDCMVMVTRTVSTCDHKISVACSQPATSDKCDGFCPKRLPCGHPCRARCREKCTAECPELVPTANKCAKGHIIKLPCYLSTTVKGESAWDYCKEPCGQMLECQHMCVGTCGGCFQGRLHVSCSQQCERQLVCGHICKYPCNAVCPPCQEACQWRCTHSKCRKRCGEPCESCKMPCDWKCKHTKCDKLCGDNCSRKPCEKPCPKKLKCGHKCVGFCGDPCPPLCRECDKEELTEFVLLGNEEDEDARFVLLEDCGHCIEAEGLEGWLAQEVGEIGMKACPKCRNPIYNNRRYQSIVLQAYKAVRAVKQKYYDSKKNLKRKDIELILQDPAVFADFISQSTTLLKCLGIGLKAPKKKYLSVGEMKLCYFQAQVLKKATSILNQQNNPDESPQLLTGVKEKGSLSKHMAALKFRVEAVVSRVMEKNSIIAPQMEREVSCELQRLMILPAYWTFQEKSAVHRNDGMMKIKALLEKLMDPTVIFDEVLDSKVCSLLKESEKYVGGLGISDSERIMILKAMGLRQGHWFKCPNGHVYCITECGGAMMESTCPECGSRIGGGSHTLRQDNSLAREMDEAQHAAWSEQNNMANFDLNNLL